MTENKKKPLCGKIYDNQKYIIIITALIGGCLLLINNKQNINKLTENLENLEMFVKNRYRIKKLPIT